MLFVSPNLDTSIVRDMMLEHKLRYNGMQHEQLNGTSKVQLGFDEEDDMHDAIASLHDAWRPDIKARGGLCVSIKYDVPRGHCFKCYNPGYTKTSRGHTARDCQEDTCFICHRNHDTEKCGLIAQKKVIQHRHHTISEREREIIAKARLQRLMHGAGHAPVEDVGSVMGGPSLGPYHGSQYPSDYVGSVIGPPPGEGRYPSEYNGSIVSAGSPLVAQGTAQTIHHHPVVRTLCSHHMWTKKASINRRLHSGTDLSGNQPISHRDTHNTTHAGVPQRPKTATNAGLLTQEACG